jgi:hypothetical protein
MTISVRCLSTLVAVTVVAGVVAPASEAARRPFMTDDVRVSPPVLNFGAVPVCPVYPLCQGPERSVRLTNVGDQAIFIDGIGVGPFFAFPEGGICRESHDAVLVPGEWCTIGIVALPPSRGRHEGILDVTDTTRRIVEIPLIARGS